LKQIREKLGYNNAAITRADKDNTVGIPYKDNTLSTAYKNNTLYIAYKIIH